MLTKTTVLLIFSMLLSVNILMAQLTPQPVATEVVKGINLGNTFEPPKEAGWNNPTAQEYYFDLYKEAGFQLVRIPVRWDGYTGKTAPYGVTEYWMNRIEQVVDWGLERGLYIVINSHHDNWIKESYTEANKARFDSIWSQIAVRFKDKSERLFFEILNEPYGLSKANNDDMHARVLSIIRKTNPTRIVIFQGHEWGGAGNLLEAAIPDDPYLLGSFHSYDPFQFSHFDPKIGQITWGTSGDIAAIDNKFKGVKEWSDTHNIPVFLGEFGSQKKCDYNSRMKHYRTYVVLAEKYGFIHCAWDDGGNFRIMERQDREWDEVKDILMHTYEKSPWPIANVYHDSIVKVNWSNYVTDHDSIIVQRRLGTVRDYQTIATMEAGTREYQDIKPAMGKYYNYRIIASYNDSIDMYSQPCQVFFPTWERKVRVPYYDTAHVVPGVIEAEDFDIGGEGLSYHDVDENNITGEYRPNEGVDIYDRLGNGYHVGNIIEGEWLEYSINVKTEGWYDVTFYLASPLGGGTFEISIDSTKSGSLTVPASYSNLTTKPVTTKMYLYPGKHIVRFTVLSGGQFNFDNMLFDLKTSVNPEITEEPVSVFMNRHKQLVIRQSPASQPESLRLYSVSGHLVYVNSRPEPTEYISTYNLPSGIYILHSKNRNERFIDKIIIQ